MSHKHARRALTVVMPCLLAFTLLSAVTWADAGRELAAGTSAADGVWISTGADAFEALQAAHLVFDQLPLVKHAEYDEVVATRVHAQDIERISLLMHERFQRCSGFIVHDDLAEATAAIEQASRASLGVGDGPGIDYVIDQAELVGQLLPKVAESNILDTMDALSNDFPNRYHAYPAGVQSAEWIRDLWAGYASAAGRTEVVANLFQHSWAQPSVILTVPGSFFPDEIVIIGGHLDSTSSGNDGENFPAPGADDNASGIAVISELVRVAMDNGFRPQRTLQFMGYAAEEVGLLGSKAIAEQYRDTDANVVAVLQFDMTAFNGSSEDIVLLSDFTNPQLTSFVGSLVDTYLPSLLRTSTACGYGCSDHAAWHNEGYPAAMPFEARFGQHNSQIHRPTDTLGTLGNSAAHSFKFAQLGVAFMVETGVVDTSILFVDGFESGSISAWSETVLEP